MHYAISPRVVRRTGVITGVFENVEEHVLTLEAARGKCDYLIVGISVSPEETFFARKRAVENLPCVDDVFIYHDAADYAASLGSIGPHLRLDELLAA